MHPIAAREALDRFIAALPAGAASATTARAATAVRGLFAAAAHDSEGADLARYADHNVAVLIARLLEGPRFEGLEAPVAELFFALRRRLLGALERDPDDLAPALALALGDALILRAPRLTFDDRLREDFAAIAAALSRPHAGARLAQAALTTLLIAGRSKSPAIAEAAHGLAAPVREAIEALGARLPSHPDLALARVQLHLLESRSKDSASDALSSLSKARGLLTDFAKRFGLAHGQRDLLAELVAERARLGIGGADMRTEVLALLELEVGEQLQTPARTKRMLKALSRADALDAECARALLKLLGLETSGGRDADPAWDEVRATLLDALGDEKALLALAERTLSADPGHAPSARRLLERWVKNIRADLAPPFESTTADRVLDAAPAAAMAKLSQDDLRGLCAATADLFDHGRVFRFLTERVLESRDGRARADTWLLALEASEAVGGPEAPLRLAGLIRGDKVPARVRLAAARALIAEGESPDAADELLRGLHGLRGAEAREVQSLLEKLRSDPRLTERHREHLIAFEEGLGVGKGKALKLKVRFVSPTYAIAEYTRAPAPEFYGHKHLRTMIRDEDLPEGTSVKDLQKGDTIETALRGQDANPDKDKGGALRLYWVADRGAVTVHRTGKDREAPAEAAPSEGDAAETVDPRTLEADFGIGAEAPLEIRVSWDGRRKRLSGRLQTADKGRFPANIRVRAESLPDGLEAQRLGRNGKRFLATVVAEDDGARRVYRVEGPMTLVSPPPKGDAGDSSQGPDAGPDAAAAQDGHLADTAPETEVSFS